MPSLRIALFCLSVSCFSLQAADSWTRLKSPHFELYTTAGEKKGREAILYFEQVRTFFAQVTNTTKPSELPVRIIAFKNERQYLPYRVSEAAFAYYVGDRSRDYIVMESIAQEHFPVAVHEYMHLLVRHSEAKFPLWLNEGFAELYSTMRPMGKKVLVGELPPGRINSLRGQSMLPLQTIISAGQDSPLYNEKNKASMFYAESWALTHMLLQGKDYRANAQAFLTAMALGKSTQEAVAAAWHKDLASVEKDLHQYLTGGQLFGSLFDVRLEKSQEEPEVSEVSGYEADLVTADLLAAIRKRTEAEEIYQRLLKDHPADPDIERSLGYLAWQSGDRLAARKHFVTAFPQTKDPQMCLHLAALAHDLGDDPKSTIAYLQKAIDLKPDYEDAAYRLGLTAVAAQQYGVGIGALLRMKHIKPEEAFAYFYSLGFAQFQLGGKDVAVTTLTSAKKWAKEPNQIENIDRLIQYISAGGAPQRGNAGAALITLAPATERQPDPPSGQGNAPVDVATVEKLEHLEGDLTQFECHGQSALLYLKTAQGPVILFLPDPGQVSIHNGDKDQFEFTCGPQKNLHIKVGYRPGPKQNNGAQGTVRTIDFP